MDWIASIATLTRVARRHQYDASGESNISASARNGDLSFFQRLAQGFQAAAVKMDDFVKELYPKMCK